MKLKIEDKFVHFRVSKAELKDVCAGKEIALKTALPNAGALHFKIVPGNKTPSLFLSYEEGCLSLHIKKTLARRLYSNLPTREALWEIQEVEKDVPLKVFFDVDIRSQKQAH